MSSSSLSPMPLRCILDQVGAVLPSESFQFPSAVICGNRALSQRKLNLDTKGKVLREPALGMRVKVAHLRETAIPWSCHIKRGYPVSSSAHAWHSAGGLSQTAGKEIIKISYYQVQNVFSIMCLEISKSL